MKKLTLTLLLASSIIHVQARTNTVPAKNAIIAIKEAPQLTAKDLAALDYAKVAGWTTLAGFGGWLLSTGFSVVVRASHFEYREYRDRYTGERRVALDEFRSNAIGKIIITGGTVAAAAVGAYYAYKSKLPHNFWTEDHENLLNIVLESSTEKEFLTAIDQFFFKERYGRPVAFAKLSEILEKLTQAKDAYIRVNPKQFAYTINVIKDNITALNNAMLIIKAQPTWLTESNAHTLECLKHEANAQATAQNIQMAAIMASRR